MTDTLADKDFKINNINKLISGKYRKNGQIDGKFHEKNWSFIKVSRRNYRKINAVSKMKNYFTAE